MSPDQAIVIAGGVGLLLIVVLVLLRRRPTLDSSELLDEESPFADLMNRRRPVQDAPNLPSHPPPRPLRNPSDHFEAGWDAAVPSVPPPPGAPKSASLQLSAAPVARTPQLNDRPHELDPELASEVRRHLARGQKIAAIKVLRDATGLGLKDCKDAIEQFERTGQLPFGTQAPLPASNAVATATSDARKLELHDPEVLAVARALMAQGKKIEAIKEVRTLTGSGLKTVKEFVESLQ